MKVIYNNGTVGEITDKQEELHVIRHTAAHIMAQAIKRLFPEADFAVKGLHDIRNSHRIFLRNKH